MLIKANRGTKLLDLIDIAMDSFRKTGKPVSGKINGFIFKVDDTFEVTATIRQYESYLQFTGGIPKTELEEYAFYAFSEWRNRQTGHDKQEFNDIGHSHKEEIDKYLAEGRTVISSVLDELFGSKKEERLRRIQVHIDPIMGMGHIQGMTKKEEAIMQNYMAESTALIMNGECSLNDVLDGILKLADKMENVSSEKEDHENILGKLICALTKG